MYLNILLNNHYVYFVVVFVDSVVVVVVAVDIVQIENLLDNNIIIYIFIIKRENLPFGLIFNGSIVITDFIEFSVIG
jgi:hypothetical protein